MSSSSAAALRALWPRIEAGRRGRRIASSSAPSGRAKRSSSRAEAVATSPTCTRSPAISSPPIPTSPNRRSRATRPQILSGSLSGTASRITRNARPASCDGSAQQIVDLLMRECADAGRARVSLDGSPKAPRTILPEPLNRLHSRRRVHGAARHRRQRRPVHSKNGRDGFGYDIARQFSIPLSPAVRRSFRLPLRAEHAQFADLTGISAPVTVACGKRRFQEEMLFTHRGLSGPASCKSPPIGIIPTQSAPNRSSSTGLPASTFCTLRVPNARRDPAAAKAALRACHSYPVWPIALSTGC